MSTAFETAAEDLTVAARSTGAPQAAANASKANVHPASAAHANDCSPPDTVAARTVRLAAAVSLAGAVYAAGMVPLVQAFAQVVS